MNRRGFIKSLSLSVLGAGNVFRTSANRCAQAATIDSPNIIVIMADDLGYGSVGCYGADPALVKTPHIDSLAQQGIRFTDASTPSSVCSPTRYGLLMGRYPWRTRMKYGVVNIGEPLLPNPNRVSLAKFLQQKGYQTASVGKWHLGYGSEKMNPHDWTKPLRPGALEMGFDYHFAVPQNHGDKTGVYIENDMIYGLESDQVYPYSKSYYGTPYFGFDAPQRDNKQVMKDLTDKAVDWLDKTSEDSPFFLYFTPVAVHHPITPSDAMRGESGCGPYGDFIQDIDESVGRILDWLESKGLSENTMIIFTSDNGGDIPPQEGRPEQTAIGLGLEINGELRGDKHTIWEGGVRVPFITCYPKMIPAGVTSTSMINLTDVFATVYEMVEGDIPDQTEMAPDSVSFYSSLLHPGQQTSQRDEMIVTNAQGIFAIRQGDWKYIEGKLPDSWKGNRKGTLNGQAIPQLYNMKNDPGERENVIDLHSDILQSMQKRLHTIRERNV